MHRIDNATAALTMPARKPPGPAGYFSGGNPQTGALATIVEADLLNALMMEVSNVITSAGITLSKTNDTQLTTAIQAMIAGAGVGFMPVQQGGGTLQAVNKVRIGWSSDSSGLRAMVDTTDLGNMAFLSRAQAWAALQTFNAGIQANDIGATGAIHSSGGNVTAGVDVIGGRDVNAGRNMNAAGQIAGGTVLSTNGNVTANNGRLRASLGSGGDPNAAVLLAEFGSVGGTSASISSMPGGYMIQSVALALSGGIGNSDTDPAHIGATATFGFAWPTVFPVVCYGAWGVGWDAGIQEGSEMSVGMVNWSQAGGLSRVSRASGSNPSGTEAFNITLFGIGR